MRLNIIQTALEKQACEERLRYDRSFSRFMSGSESCNKTEQFVQMINENKRRGRNNIFEIFGPTGTTKSYCGMTVSATIDPNFEVYNASGFPRKMFFERSIFTSDMKDFVEGDSPMLDEQPTEHGMGKERVAGQMHNFVETIRKKKISFTRCSPVRKSTIELALSHWVIECVPGYVDEEQEIAKCALQTNTGLTLGYLLISHPNTKLSKKFIDKYEEMKDIFLDRITGKKGTSAIGEKAKAVFGSEEFQKFYNSVAKITNDDLYAFVDEKYPELKMNVEHFMVSRKLRVIIKRKDPSKLYGTLTSGQQQVDASGKVLNIG